MSGSVLLAEKRKEYADDQLLARLIGAAVLLAIAVIVLPFVLDGAGSQHEYEYAETQPVQPQRNVVERSYSSRQPLAPAPVIEEVQIEKPRTAVLADSVEKVAENAVAMQQPQGVESITALESGDGGIQTFPISDGWNIQVASFVKAANAQKLIRRLSNAGLPAYINEVAGKSRNILRVFVGPIGNQIDALALKNRIDQEYRVESIMVRRN